MPLAKPSGFSRLLESHNTPAAYGDWEKRLPFLCAFLCDVKWADGVLRVPGKLGIWTGDGLWKGHLTAPADHAIAFWSAQEPSALLQLMERSIARDEVDWRRSVEYDKKSTKRR